MTGARQYVEVKFRAGARQSYTYHNDGEPVVPGDTVKIAGRGDDGWQKAFVESITFTPPAFDTKPIIGRVDPSQPDLIDSASEPDLFAAPAKTDPPEEEEEEGDRADCGYCYGNGCFSCGNKGWVETATGRERREEWEDGAYDRARDARLMGED